MAEALIGTANFSTGNKGTEDGGTLGGTGTGLEEQSVRVIIDEAFLLLLECFRGLVRLWDHCL